MAAADYYNPGGQHQQPPGPAPAPAYPQQPPQQQHLLNPNPPYPMFDGPPPPYSAFADHQRPHSQPPPQNRPPVNEQYRPPQPPNGHQANHGYPPDKSPRPAPPQVHNMYRPSDFGGQHPPQPQQLHPQPPHQDYFPLAGTPAMAQVYGGNNGGRRPSTTPGYRPPQSPYRDDYKRDESTTRDRSRSRSRRRHHHHDRPQIHRKKSSGVNTFLGAGGGALIGDAIFPGLGTLGGAILGGLGGHEYGRRTTSNPNRSRARSYSNDFDYGDDHRRGRKH